MENKSHALAAGAFVLAVAALLVGLAMWLLRDVANTVAYELVSSEAVSGLQPQAPVRFKGVAVGKVTDISFDPTNRANVLVRLAVAADAPVTKSTFATLAYQGVTGLSFVQLDDPGGSSEPLPRGPNGPPRIPLRPNLFGQLSDQAQDLVSKLDTSVERVNALLAPDNQAALIAAVKELGGAAREAGAAARSLGQLAAHTDKTIEAQFGPRHSSIPQLVKQATSTLKTLEGAGVQANAAALELKRGVATATGPGGLLDRLSESAGTITSTTLPQIQHLTEDASRTIRRLDRIANSVGENPQVFIYGSGAIPPGPGEPGFVAPAAP